MDELRKSYQANIGDLENFPDAILDWASPPTTWEILVSAVDVSRVLNSPALGGDEVIPAVMNYVNAKKTLKNADDEIACNQNLIKDLINATKNPKLPNACQFKDPPAIKPLYKLNLTDKGQIENALSNINSSITVDFKIVKSTKSEMRVNFNSGDSIDVSAYINQNDWLTTTINNSIVSISGLISSLSLFEISVQFVWKGITALTPTPAAYDHPTGNGWYSSSEINEAIRNQNSGWAFSSNPKSTKFSIISQLIISNPPEINILATAIINEGNILSVLRHSEPLPDGVTNFSLFGWNFGSNCEYQSKFTLDSKSYQFNFVPMLVIGETANILGAIVWSPFLNK